MSSAQNENKKRAQETLRIFSKVKTGHLACNKGQDINMGLCLQAPAKFGCACLSGSSKKFQWSVNLEVNIGSVKDGLSQVDRVHDWQAYRPKSKIQEQRYGQAGTRKRKRNELANTK